MGKDNNIPDYFENSRPLEIKIKEKTLESVSNFKTNDIDGKTADLGILDFIKKNGGIVATMDQNLKNQIKESGGSVLSMHNDKIVLEN